MKQQIVELKVSDQVGDNMTFEVTKAVAVKPDLIRFTVEVFTGAEIDSEYELVIHTNDFATLNAQGGVMEMKIDLNELQQRITDEITKMTVTAGVASAINQIALKWEVERGVQDSDAGSESDPDNNNSNS